jgi:small-conductance mechanosensitive channel
METLMPFCRAAAAAFIGLLLAASPMRAQEQPLTVILKPGQSAADVQQVLDLATRTGRPLTVQVNAAPTGNTAAAATAPPAAGSAPAAPGTAAPMQTTPEMEAANMGMATWERFSTASARGFATAITGLSALSTVVAMTSSKLDAEGIANSRIALATLISLLAGLAAAFGVRLLFAQLVRHRRVGTRRIAGKFRRFFKRLMGDLLSIAIFLGVARRVLPMMLADTTAAFQVAQACIAVALISLVYIAVGRFLFRADASGETLIAIRKPQWHFHMLVAYGVITGFFGETMRLWNWLGLDRTALDGCFLIGGTILTLLKLTWFGVGRASIRDAFTGTSPGPVRRVVGNLLPDFYIVSAIFIWFFGSVIVGAPDSPRWSFAAGSTQVILLLLPIVALGAHHVVDEFARHWETTHGAGLWSSVLASLRVVCSGAVWIGGLHLITALWWPLMSSGGDIATSWILWLERLSFAVVASWAVYTLVWKYAETIAPPQHVLLPGQEDDQADKKQTSRLTTALPVIRNLVLGAVLAVGSLIVLSSLGVNVAPLLAGFGVLGLALSFGSQALVKDVVSGIFFIVDDAFRIGEYIDAGKLQGTVEQITVRSVRLRHHNGPIHTIPFGQISSVTNFSRDWGTIKFQIRFERDSDAEVIRRAAKKVGLGMLEDPEYGPQFLIPLKMQGIQDITETSMIVRFKFTCLPGNPSILKREAMTRLLAACKAAGVQFASNAVTVRSNGSSSIDIEAAAAGAPPALTSVAV